MTGSKLQWYNGMLLIGVFVSCRLVWGTWQSIVVYKDMFAGWTESRSFLEGVPTNAPIFQVRDGALCTNEDCLQANAEISRFANHFIDTELPYWLPLIYVASNVALNGLNWYWISQMIDAVMKRFREPAAEVKVPPKRTEPSQPDILLDAAEKLKQEQGYFETGDRAEQVLSTGAEAAQGGDALTQRKP